MTALLIAETVVVFAIAYHYTGSFHLAAQVSIIVNGLLTIGFLVAALRTMRKLDP